MLYHETKIYAKSGYTENGPRSQTKKKDRIFILTKRSEMWQTFLFR